MKTALITGANGQDAFYLTKFLLQKNYRIVLTTRRLISDFFTQFCIDLGDLSLKNNNTIIIESKDFEYKEIKNIITQYEISEIYNLGGHSNVVNSFKNPSLIIKDPLKNFETLTKIIIDLGSHIKLFQASSSEMFEDIGIEVQYEVAQKYHVRSVPTVIIENNGKEVQRFTGVQSEMAYINALNENL